LCPDKGVIYDQPLLELDVLKRDRASGPGEEEENQSGEEGDDDDDYNNYDYDEEEDDNDHDDSSFVDDVWESVRVLRHIGEAKAVGDCTEDEEEESETNLDSEHEEEEETTGSSRRWWAVASVELRVKWERSRRRDLVTLAAGDCVMMRDEQRRPYFSRIERILCVRYPDTELRTKEDTTGVWLECRYFYAADQTVMGAAGRKIAHQRELYASTDVGRHELECVQAKACVSYIDDVKDWSLICGYGRFDASDSAPNAPTHFYRYLYSPPTHVFTDAKAWSSSRDPSEFEEQEANEEESIEDYFGTYEQVTCAREASMKRHGRWLGINHKFQTQRTKCVRSVLVAGLCARLSVSACRLTLSYVYA
jgi:hypothetical protein